MKNIHEHVVFNDESLDVRGKLFKNEILSLKIYSMNDNFNDTLNIIEYILSIYHNYNLHNECDIELIKG